MSKLYTGTVKQLVGKVAVNGRNLSAAELSTVCKLFAKNVGTDAKPARGKPATIWELESNGTFTVTDGVPSNTTRVSAPASVSDGGDSSGVLGASV